MVKSTNKTLREIIEYNDNQNYCPIYQRDYKWPKILRQKMLADVMRVDEDTNIDFGSIYLNHLPSGGNGSIGGKTQIVDGQQRMTSYSIDVAALCAYCSNNDIEDNWRELLYYPILINRKFSDDMRFKLKLKKANDKYFKNLVSTLPNINDDENKLFNETNMINDAYIQAYNFVDELNKYDELDIFMKNILEVKATECILEENDNPQECFNNHNNLGHPLTVDENVCSYLIFRAGDSEENQEKIYYQYWDNINKYFSGQSKKFETLLNAISQIENNHYVTAIIQYMNEKIFSKDKSIELLKNINHYFDIYKKINEGDTGILIVDNSLKFITARLNSFILSSLFKIFDLWYKSLISKECFINSILTLETHIMRCWMSGKDNSDSIRTVFKLDDFDKTEFSLDYYLFSKIKSEGYFVSDNEFKEKFKYYKFKQSQLVKPVLLRIINYEHPEEQFNLFNTSTEHIMAQKLNNEWIEDLGENHRMIHEMYLDTICNLTLLPKGWNTALSNKSFFEKLYHEKGYLNSKLPLNKQLADYSVFNKESLEDRGDYLTNEALKIWKYPSSVVYGENTIQSNLVESK